MIILQQRFFSKSVIIVSEEFDLDCYSIDCSYKSGTILKKNNEIIFEIYNMSGFVYKEKKFGEEYLRKCDDYKYIFTFEGEAFSWDALANISDANWKTICSNVTGDNGGRILVCYPRFEFFSRSRYMISCSRCMDLDLVLIVACMVIMRSVINAKENQA